MQTFEILVLARTSHAPEVTPHSLSTMTDALGPTEPSPVDAAPLARPSSDEQRRESSRGARGRLLLVRALVAGVVAGSSQLVAWLGRGVVDPWAGPLITMQFTVFLAFVVQVVAFVPAWALSTERFYDAVGAATYLLCLSYSLAAGYTVRVVHQGNALDAHAFAASAMFGIWAVR